MGFDRILISADRHIQPARSAIVKARLARKKSRPSLTGHRIT